MRLHRLYEFNYKTVNNIAFRMCCFVAILCLHKFHASSSTLSLSSLELWQNLMSVEVLFVCQKLFCLFYCLHPSFMIFMVFISMHKLLKFENILTNTLYYNIILLRLKH